MKIKMSETCKRNFFWGVCACVCAHLCEFMHLGMCLFLYLDSFTLYIVRWFFCCFIAFNKAINNTKVLGCFNRHTPTNLEAIINPYFSSILFSFCKLDIVLFLDPSGCVKIFWLPFLCISQIFLLGGFPFAWSKFYRISFNKCDVWQTQVFHLKLVDFALVPWR